MDPGTLPSHGLSTPRRLGHVRLRPLLRQLDHPRQPDRGGRRRSPASQAALDAGITTFDTADVYALGRAESVLGRALKGVRPRLHRDLHQGLLADRTQSQQPRAVAQAHHGVAATSSLQRLQTDHVDLLQAHRYDFETPLEETLRAFDDLVRQGKVHYVGVSEWTAEQIADALRLADEMGFDRIVSNQPQYSLIWRVIEAEVVPLCEKEGVGPDRVVAAGPGRAHRQVPARCGPAPPRGHAGHRARGRGDELAAARRGPRAGAAYADAVPRGGLHAGRRWRWPGCCATRT